MSSLEVKSTCTDCSMLDNRAGPFLAFADFFSLQDDSQILELTFLAA